MILKKHALARLCESVFFLFALLYIINIIEENGAQSIC